MPLEKATDSVNGCVQSSRLRSDHVRVPDSVETDFGHVPNVSDVGPVSVAPQSQPGSVGFNSPEKFAYLHVGAPPEECARTVFENPPLPID